MTEADETLDESQGLIRRACDQCRFRKIRCDKVTGTPCSHCKRAKRECTSTGGQKPQDTRQRVSVSHQYERKIERVEERLASMEDMLRNLTKLTTSVRLSSTPGQVYATPTAPIGACSSVESSTAYEPTPADEEGDHAFEGNSSMAAHIVFASDFIEEAVVSRSINHKVTPDFQNALASLRQMVQLQNRKGLSQDSRFAHARSVAEKLGQLPLPPTNAVLKLLRDIKTSPPVTFARDCVFITVDGFIDYCRRVFFATEEYNAADFVIVNAALYFLFQEKSVICGSGNEDYRGYQYLCRDNLETALSSLPLLSPAKRETIEALLFGVVYSIEISKFTMAWQLNSAAAAMCQALGWHRLQPGELEEANDTRLASFWFCYMQDKSLSLRFGRTSVIRDLEISAPRCFGNVTHMTQPWKEATALWIQTGSVLGATYDNLYSPEALTRSPEERVNTARQLAEKRKHLFEGLQEISASLQWDDSMGMSSKGGDAGREREARMIVVEMILKSAEVSHLACLTLIYRALPSSPGSPSSLDVDCIETARTAFQRHQECMELTADNFFARAGYLRWTLLYDTFAPLVVLFCHVIETSDHGDIQRLARFTESLEPVSSMSLAMEKFCRVCRVLYHIATLYVEAKAQTPEQPDHDMSMIGNDFDLYLGQLGFLPSEPQNASHGLAMPGSIPTSNLASAQLGDWFSGNNHVMGLMEDDFFGL